MNSNYTLRQGGEGEVPPSAPADRKAKKRQIFLPLKNFGEFFENLGNIQFGAKNVILRKDKEIFFRPLPLSSNKIFPTLRLPPTV